VLLLFMSFTDLIIPGQVAFYLFLAVMLAWIEVIAIRLRSIAMGALSGRVMSTG
jgi:heme exporter protein D